MKATYTLSLTLLKPVIYQIYQEQETLSLGEWLCVSRLLLYKLLLSSPKLHETAQLCHDYRLLLRQYAASYEISDCKTREILLEK